MAYLVPDRKYDANGITVNEYLLTKHNPNDIDMPYQKITPTSITIHNTDWINVSSETTPAEQYSRATVNGNLNDVRIHFYVDDKCAWQNLPLDLMSWHSGTNEGNRTSISIECIMSGNYNATDKKSEDNAAKLAAYLLKKFNFGIDKMVTHKYWNGKQCPLYILPHWNDFVNKVKSYMGSTPVIPAQEKLYRVRKSWNDVASQIGAYKSLDSAKGICKEGYFVFDNDGKVVYPIVVETCKAELPVVKKGDKGSSVKAVQILLMSLGYDVGSYGADSDYGNATETAVKKLQKDKGIEQSGKVDGATWKALLS